VAETEGGQASDRFPICLYSIGLIASEHERQHCARRR
jgi:hypothetical protein